MPLMSEYALTPAVFDSMHYSSDEIIESNFALLKEALFNEGIVRNLYGGEWREQFSDPGRSWHQRGKELLKKLIKQNRLRPQAPSHNSAPVTDHEWCEEALRTHESLPLGGIITTPETAALYSRTHPLVTNISKLSSSLWWSKRGSSARLCRNTADYLEHLRLVLECSNSLMFIDRNLDPTRMSYREFIKLLEPLRNREVPPLVEIHRTIYANENGRRVTYGIDEWRRRFCESLSGLVAGVDLKIEVFIWDEMHDRYLISDIFGILAPNGFDISRNPAELTTWTCVSRSDRDDITREYDPACHRHHLYGRFLIA